MQVPNLSSVICHLSFCRASGEAISAKQRRFGLGDDALVGQEVIGDDVVDLFDFIEQAIGQGYEFVGLKNPAWAFFRFEEKRVPI
jgi:hypothetical protein